MRKNFQKGRKMKSRYEDLITYLKSENHRYDLIDGYETYDLIDQAIYFKISNECIEVYVNSCAMTYKILGKNRMKQSPMKLYRINALGQYQHIKTETDITVLLDSLYSDSSEWAKEYEMYELMRNTFPFSLGVEK